jgi:hypothetical protein
MSPSESTTATRMHLGLPDALSMVGVTLGEAQPKASTQEQRSGLKKQDSGM